MTEEKVSSKFIQNTFNKITNEQSKNLRFARVAIAENQILVTNNTRHYQRITDLNIDNWSNEQ